MKSYISLLSALVCLCIFTAGAQIPRTISYEGVLTDAGGAPVADGTYTLAFRIYDVAVGGQFLWMESQDVAVSKGHFRAQLGTVTPLNLPFDKPYWLGMSVNWGVELSPRTPLNSVPYSFSSLSVPDGSITAGKLANGAVTKEKLAAAGGSAGQVLSTNGTNLQWITPGGGSSGDSWKLLGNAGIDTNSHFLGTTDKNPLLIKVNNNVALRLIPTNNVLKPSINLIAGYYQNYIQNGVEGATISGGGTSLIMPLPPKPQPNRVTDDFGTIGGGADNQAGDANDKTYDASYATVSGGGSNLAMLSGATVGGGFENQAKGMVSTIGGGMDNLAEYKCAVVAGGCENQAKGTYAAICGGFRNSATGEGAYIGGGRYNKAEGTNSVVLGGNTNVCQGTEAMVLGGYNNYAVGDYSLAAGYRAHANKKGSFVWGDATNANINCDVENRWMARASGGVYFYTNGALTTGAYLAAGGSGWNSVSGRIHKENFSPIDKKALLKRLAEIDISAFNYKAQSPEIRHIGPVAEDFNSLLEGLGGEGFDHINTMDGIGISLAAIQGLYQLLQEQADYIKKLEETIHSMQK